MAVVGEKAKYESSYRVHKGETLIRRVNIIFSQLEDSAHENASPCADESQAFFFGE